ncbi:hypothetical protein MKX01_037994 [Papaver californicum]|nr:hypothetical protein MKX01_037994 [Papaver californicum]
MSSSEVEPDFPDMVCQIDNVQGMVDALSSVRWKHFGCIRAKVYLKREIWSGLGLFVDCLNTFSLFGHLNTIEMQLLFKYSAALKEAVDDLEWPGACIQITLVPDPHCATFRGEGHGDLQIDFMYYANTDLLMVFQCDRRISYMNFVFSFPTCRYKYKFLKATTSTIPTSVKRENRGSKLTIGRGGMLKVQHLVSVSRSSVQHTHIDSADYPQPSRIAYIEFFVNPEEDDENPINDT